MITKYADEQFVHSFPFQLAKGDHIVSATVKAYQPVKPITTEAVVRDAEIAGYSWSKSGKYESVTYPLSPGHEAYFCIRQAEPTLVEQAGIVGDVTVMQTGPETWEVRAVLKGGAEGQTYAIIVSVQTGLGEKLTQVEQLTIKTMLQQ